MDKRQANILIIDDDSDILLAAKLFLKRHYQKVVTLDNPSAIPAIMKKCEFDLFLLDMNFALGLNTGREGLHWLQKIISINPDAVVVLMTAYGDVELSVKAIKLGAIDFVLKPWKNEKLLATLNSALLLSKSRKQVKRLNERQKELMFTNENTQVVGQSNALMRVLEISAKAAKTDANILILGENGAGKEVIAHEIYRQSSRASEVMLNVDLGAVPENLFESELFGHVKGAFTDANSDRPGRFQAASGGTLFLDEIGNLPLHLQAKLLRVIENKEVTPVGSDKLIKVDVRLICATNMPLQKLVDEGKFRADLYYRINTLQIELAPLRERASDIPLLLNHFIAINAQKYQFPEKKITSSALKVLCQYHWPGNVRELANAVERALILGDHDELVESDFLLNNTNTTNLETFNDCNLERIEKSVISHCVEKHLGNISHAAAELGITRTSLYRRIKKHQL
ncbi:sigma-54 dependent transcriptional regulator [Colwellia sp. E2M01]|uniref:sigma-54-dependent transcriptional regulator n=1 Tax=Colwellia sp. E2M01 TaxID=2841561 RepID=UPI001C0805B3|nr:sigma-54 dependent transcriptional regulator [Colwellia sp. E2M01]MBU2871597.1 sigma-54 dependent transcriptional regulator [Colwellia sp. E2M01]